MSAWLVTGGAGFIGANFVRLASKIDVELVVLDALTYAGNIANISDLIDSRRITFVKGDICDEDVVKSIFLRHRVDRVAHFAAESHVDRSILGPRPFIRTNVEGTCVLLEAARASWEGETDGKCFLHISTDEVFGSLAPEDPAFSEISPYRPNSPYSASKAAADHLARAWHRSFGLPVVVSNCSNNYGPLQFPEKLIPLMILNAIDGRELPVYGDGEQVRDWLHVEDHCRALLLLLQRGRPGQMYAIGGDCERTNIDIVHRICAEVDHLVGKPSGTSKRLVRHVRDRAGHDRRYAMNSSKLKAELGWRPRRSIDEALPELVRWYHDNRDWSEAIRLGEYLTYYTRQYGDR